MPSCVPYVEVVQLIYCTGILINSNALDSVKVPTLLDVANTRRPSEQSGSHLLLGIACPDQIGTKYFHDMLEGSSSKGNSDPTVFISGQAIGRYVCWTGHLRAAFSWGWAY